MFDELVFGHYPVTMLNQVGEHIKDLGLELDHMAAAAQLIALEIELVNCVEGKIMAESRPARNRGGMVSGAMPAHPGALGHLAGLRCQNLSLGTRPRCCAGELLGGLDVTLLMPQPAQTHRRP